MSKIENSLFINFPSILLISLPFFLITGAFLSDLSVSLIGIFFLIYSFKKKKFDFFKSKYFILFLLFCFFIILSGVINHSNFSSLKSSLFYFRFGVFVGAIIFLLENKKNLLKYFYYSLLICFSMLIVDSFIQYFTGQNILGWKMNSAENRISSFFGDEYILGSYISRLLPIIFACALYFKSKNNKLFFFTLVILFLSEVVVFLSGERASFFFINLSAIFIMIFIKGHKLARLTTLLLAFITIFIISIYNESAKKRIVDLTFQQFNIFSGKKSEDKKIYAFSKQHTHHYISALRMFKDNKIIGVGVKNFRYKCSEKEYFISEFSCSTHPHHTYLQFLSETGLIGFCFLLYACFYFIKFVFKKLIMKTEFVSNFEVALLSGILITLWPLVPTGSFFNNWLSIVYYLPLGFFLWSRKNLTYKENKTKI